jgi:hypothetical protein
MHGDLREGRPLTRILIPASPHQLNEHLIHPGGIPGLKHYKIKKWGDEVIKSDVNILQKFLRKSLLIILLEKSILMIVIYDLPLTIECSMRPEKNKSYNSNK